MNEMVTCKKEVKKVTVRVSVIGPTGSGKSSLVNALLGASVATTRGDGAAVTSVPTEYYNIGSIENINKKCEQEKVMPDRLGTLLDHSVKSSGIDAKKPQCRYVIGFQFISRERLSELCQNTVEVLGDQEESLLGKTKNPFVAPLLDVLVGEEKRKAFLKDSGLVGDEMYELEEAELDRKKEECMEKLKQLVPGQGSWR